LKRLSMWLHSVRLKDCRRKWSCDTSRSTVPAFCWTSWEKLWAFRSDSPVNRESPQKSRPV
jgi:hypothetical protein